MEVRLPDVIPVLTWLVELDLSKLELRGDGRQNYPLERVLLDGEDPGPLLFYLLTAALLLLFPYLHDALSLWRLGGVVVELRELVVVDGAERPALF